MSGDNHNQADQTRTDCRTCNGSGRVGTADDNRPCNSCNGRGEVSS